MSVKIVWIEELALGLLAPAGVFLQFPLQGAAMHVQGPGRGRDIAVVLIENALDMFPFHFFYRGWLRAQFRWRFQGLETTDQLLYGHRFAQVVDGSAAHGLYGCGNAAVAGQHQYFQVRVGVEQFWQQLQPALAGQVQVEHAAADVVGIQRIQGAVVVAGGDGLDTLPGQGAAQHLQEGLVVINNQPLFLFRHIPALLQWMSRPVANRSPWWFRCCRFGLSGCRPAAGWWHWTKTGQLPDRSWNRLYLRRVLRPGRPPTLRRGLRPQSLCDRYRFADC